MRCCPITVKLRNAYALTGLMFECCLKTQGDALG